MSWKPDHPPIAVLKLHTVSDDVKDPGGEVATELPFWRRIKAKHLAMATKKGLTDETGEARTLYMLSQLTGFAADQLAELDAYDFGQATEVINYFLVLGPKVNFAKRVLGLSLAAFPESTSENLTTKT